MNCKQYYSELLQFVEDKLQFYTDYSTNIYQSQVMEAMRYSLLGGGKRIRAVLALEFCKAFSGDRDAAAAAACALEMVHAYSLIHDDLPCMDDDDMRRGKPSSHKQFGEALAVLAGDGLLTLAFETLSRDDTVEKLGAKKAIDLVKALSFASGEYGMLGGQVIDVMNEGKSLEQQVHSDMVAMKTGALIKAAVNCGCISGGADAQQTEKALEYAELIGRAFQITDDILDVVGDSALLGKNVGSDEKDNKVTFVSMYGVEKAQQMADDMFCRAKEILCSLLPDNEFLLWLTDLLAHRTS